MKKLVLAIACLMLFQSMAMAETTSALKKLVDDYRYTVTVEWDQKDETFLKEIRTQFRKDLSALSSKEAITVAALREAVASSGTMDQELQSILALENEKVIAQELQALIENRGETMSAHGASWSPGAVFGTGLVILFVLEIIALTMRDAECPNDVTYPEGVRYDCIWGDEN